MEHDEFDRAGVTMHKRVDAIFAGTQSLLDAATPIRNVIMALDAHRTELEDAVAATYYRAYMIIESLTRLNTRQDFQVALHCARCLYELYLDLIDLIDNPSFVTKFNAFIFVARYSAAEKLVAELIDQGINDVTIEKAAREHVANPNNKARFDLERVTHWPGKNGKATTPLNWTGETLPVRTRRISLDEALRYRRVYPQLCWFSHGGLAGIANVSATGLEAGMGTAHAHAQFFFVEATHRVAIRFQIYKANPELREPVERYRDSIDRRIAEYLLRQG